MAVAYDRDKKYATEIIVCSLEDYAVSKAAYNCLREYLKLPSVHTLTRITSKIKTIGDSSYIKQFYKS